MILLLYCSKSRYFSYCIFQRIYCSIWSKFCGPAAANKKEQRSNERPNDTPARNVTTIKRLFAQIVGKPIFHFFCTVHCLPLISLPRTPNNKRRVCHWTTQSHVCHQLNTMKPEWNVFMDDLKCIFDTSIPFTSRHFRLWTLDTGTLLYRNSGDAGIYCLLMTKPTISTIKGR